MTAVQEADAARTSVYVVERAGKQIGNIKKAFQAASEGSSVHATPYTLRHTGAVWAAEAGVPMSELAQMLGHDDDRTTQQHYARYSPGYLKRVADAIEKGRISACGSKGTASTCLFQGRNGGKLGRGERMPTHHPFPPTTVLPPA